MKYNLFLFDLDDTLLDFRASEKESFRLVLESLGITENPEDIFARYQQENRALWKAFEEGKVGKEELKTARFARTFQFFGLDQDPQKASERYLEALSETVVLIDHAEEICQWAASQGELGIITNGIHATQTRRIARSRLEPYISFMAVSEECGFAKPDVRFFEYGVGMARKFSRETTLMIGDRLETDVAGARNFGIDSCWFNPLKDKKQDHDPVPHLEISHLSELRSRLVR